MYVSLLQLFLKKQLRSTEQNLRAFFLLPSIKNSAILGSFTKLLHHFLSSALTQKQLSSRAAVLSEVNDCIWQYTIIDLRVTSMMV